MSLDEFIVELGSSVKFKTRLDDLLSESCNFRLQPSTLRFSVGDSLLHIAFFPLIFGSSTETEIEYHLIRDADWSIQIFF